MTGPIVAHVFGLWGMSTTMLMLVGVTLIILATFILPLIEAVKRLPDKGVVGNEAGGG